MAIVTYRRETHGFGVTYDDARFACIDDPDDPRLAAAWLSRICRPIAAAVLFTAPGSTADQIAAGSAFCVLVATDDTPQSPRALGAWDWEAVTQREALRFLDKTGAALLNTEQLYWRGFPVVQFEVAPPPDALPTDSVELLGLLFTPERTFSSLLVAPWDDVGIWRAPAQEIMDGFFLVPIEREGRVRTSHQFVKSLRIVAADARNGAGIL